MPKQTSRENSTPREASGNKKTILRSSNGCAQCKRRKVKCDETHPECSNCIKHRISCSYNAQSLPTSNHPTGLDAEKLREFELLHHFCTVTHSTLSRRRDVHVLMQTTTPLEALNHPFLLYSVFAVSALHLAHVRPDQRHFYIDLAITYQNRALKSYMTIGPEINESNCGAVLVFSSFVSIYSLALAAAGPSAGSSHDDIEACIAWMNLTRGVASVLVSAREDIRRSKFELLVSGHTGDTQYPLPDLYKEIVDALPSLWISSEILTSEHDTYSATNQSLRFVLGEINHLLPHKPDLGTSLTWVGRVPQEFVAMLTARKPVALVLLAYFCVVLDTAKEFWCVDAWPKRLLASIYALLDEPYRAWIKLPMEIIGIPDSESARP